MLRPGEICSFKVSDIRLPGIVSKWQRFGVCIIWDPKTRKKGPRIQHVLIRSKWLLDLLTLYLAGKPANSAAFPSYGSLNNFVKRMLCLLGLDKMGYTLGGIRAGAASLRYLALQDICQIQRIGRWASARTLEHYLQPATAFLTMHNWPILAVEKVQKLADTKWVQPFLAEYLQT